MQVTQITEVSKNRNKVFIDFEFAFVLYKGELHLYRIQEGQEISEADYQTIMNEVLPKRAKLRCMNLLKSRDYTRVQLTKKLMEGGYPEEVIENAITYVESFGYVNDNRYAQNYINCYAQFRSHKRIEYELMQKGISKEKIEEAFNVWQEEGNRQDEEEMIRQLLEKKKWNIDVQDRKEQQRMVAFLVRKGFRTENIFRVMKNCDM